MNDTPKNPNTSNNPETPEIRHRNFIEDIIDADNASGKWASEAVDARVHTRFPPEPNGFLHIGHAKSICLNFGLAEQYDGLCNLRFDDTNPAKEEDRYVTAIKEDVQWLGFDIQENGPFFASDYFQKFYDFAVQLIQSGNAYVCDLTPDETRKYRGTLTEPGRDSPHRNRSVEENLDLFTRMKNGEFPDGSRTLRAKIDMSSPNLNLRDPVMYRILHANHHRTGSEWNIYPMYDWAHGLEDAIEGITHSICTLEFEDHRPLYDWFLDRLDIHHPQQIEFGPLNLSYTILSKRKLLQLVNENHVTGWYDPRMPTLSGMRRRGYTPESIRNFCERIGVAKRDTTVDVALLEHCIREDLNKRAPRALAIQNPLKLVIDNYPEGESETFVAINNPEDESAGTRNIPFSRELYIERDDFLEDPPRKFFRLGIGREVRLRYACLITCKSVTKDAYGNITEVHCEWDPDSRGGNAPDGRKVRGTIHWLSVAHAIPAEIRLYERLFNTENPNKAPEGSDFLANLNPESLTIVKTAFVEPSLANASPESRYQFERSGYYCTDKDSRPGAPVFNRTVPLRDSWAKKQAK